MTTKFLPLKVLAFVLVFCAHPVWADERVSICFNYSCRAQAEVVFSEPQLLELGQLISAANSAEQERVAISQAVGRLLGWAGQRTPIGADRGGNTADQNASGSMDCIDHSTTTTRLLRMLEQRGLLHYHRVLDPALRQRFVIFDHFSAQIEEIAPPDENHPPPRFVVDSWFYDNGQPAAVMPLALWMAGEGPDVGY